MNKYDAPVAQNVDGSLVKLPYPYAQISSENKRILSLYFELVIEYDKYAGAGKGEAYLRNKLGLSDVQISSLKRYYELSQTDASGQGEMNSAEQILASLQTYIPDIVKIQQMSPAEYVNLDIETLTADSVFYYFVEMYEVAGGDGGQLVDALEANGVDVARSNRLYQQFRANNPEAFNQLGGGAASD